VQKNLYTKDLLRQPDGLIEANRYAFRQNVLFNSSMKDMGFLMNAVGLCLPVFCNTFLFRYSKILGKSEIIFFIVLSFFTLSLTIAIFSIAGACNKISNSIHISWKTYVWSKELDSAVMKRVFRCIKPVEIKLGIFYSVKMYSVLQFIRIVTIYTGRAMIAFN